MPVSARPNAIQRYTPAMNSAVRVRPVGTASAEDQPSIMGKKPPLTCEMLIGPAVLRQLLADGGGGRAAGGEPGGRGGQRAGGGPLGDPGPGEELERGVALAGGRGGAELRDPGGGSAPPQAREALRLPARDRRQQGDEIVRRSQVQRLHRP